MRSEGWSRRVKNERGATLVMVAMSMVFLLGMAALAVDVGNLYLVRTEAQRVADAASLAGAGWLIVDPDDEDGARQKAIEYGAENTVQGQPVTVLPEDVDVILDSAKVRVRVYQTSDRGTAVSTFFARILGIDYANVTAMAAAWAAPEGSLTPSFIDCPLPIALLDKWDDTNGNDTYDEGEPYDPDGTGYDDDDVGTLIVAKVSGAQTQGGPLACRTESPYVDRDACRDEPLSSNWRCWYMEEESAGGGVDVLGPRIYPGESCGLELSVGDPVWAASGSGNKQSLVHTDYDAGGPGSFLDLINADPDIEWNSVKGCPVGVDGECVENSPRIRSVPMVRPDGVHGTGAGVTSTIADFTGVFVDKVACNYDLPQGEASGGNLNVYLRLMRSGDGTGSGGGNTPGPSETTLKVLRLIE